MQKNTLILKSTSAGLEVSIPRLPNTARLPAELVEMSTAVPIVARPVFRAEDPSDFTETDQVATYKRATLRAILIGSTDRLSGWQDAEFPEVREGEPTLRKRTRSWL